MKAYALTASDRPAGLIDLPDPTAPEGGLVVRMLAASVNGMDIHQSSGALIGMMPHDLPTVIGRDVAGVVESVGAGRNDFGPGDEVIAFLPAMPPLKAGAWAELVALGPDAAVAPKPAEISFEAAAALPLAGVTARDAVEAAEIRAGETVVIAGATGGVGSFAVQLAAQRGARVVATAKGEDEVGYVRALGAAEVIDYGAQDVADALRKWFPDGIDVLIDVVNRGDAFDALAGLVKEGGRIATTLGTADADALAARGVRATNIMATPTPEKIADLAQQLAKGSLRIEVQQTFPLTDADSALSAFAAGTRGKLVLVAG